MGVSGEAGEAGDQEFAAPDLAVGTKAGAVEATPMTFARWFSAMQLAMCAW
jgi:hypothetical protein